MAEDIVKSSGSSKASKPDSGGGVIRSVPVFGVVKNNIDPTRTGRIQVYISDLGGDDPDDSSQWATVSYMSPFYGFVEPTSGDTGDGDFASNPASYGIWNSPPDLESTVICIFINGDPNYGFYIGAAPKAEALHMVPAIGSSKNILPNNDGEAQSFGGATTLPVTNINTNNTAISDNENFLDQAKPIHSYVASILFKQGLIRDSLRGPITTGAQRESPSRVGWGVSSPGRPIYAGGYDDKSIAAAAVSGKDTAGLKLISRRGGHSIVLDDGDITGKDDLVRVRTAAGHQLLMSDDGQTIFIIHSNGQSWIEMGKEGTIDMFCTNSFNVRTQGDINFHADNNINIHAKKQLNIKAEDIYINSEKSTSHNIGTDYKVETVGKFMHKVGGTMSMRSGGEASFHSAGITYINGSKVNLNSGAGPAPDAVAALKDIAQTDTLFDSVKGYVAAPGKLKTITNRAPAHSPWANANQGVNVKTSTNASDSLPAAASPAAAAANASAAASPTGNPVQPAGLASVPPVSPASAAVSPQATASMIGAVASNAANGPAAAAIATGSGVVQTSAGPVASLGALAQSPKQLETAGLLKPGSSALVDSLVKSGTSLDNAIPSNLFTGKDGVASIKDFTQSQGAQLNGMVTNFQQSQSALTNAGLISGKESPTSIAGMVMAGATAGIDATVNTVKNITSSIKLPTAGLPGVPNPVTNAMNSGNFAAGLAESSTGGMGAIASATAAIAGLVGGAKLQGQGASAAAFGVIAASLTALPRGPINLGSLSAANMNTALARGAGVADPLTSAAQILRTTGQIMGGQVAKVTSAASGALSAVSRLDGAQTPAQSMTAMTGVIGGIGSIGSSIGNKSIAKVSGQVNALLGASTQIDRGLSQLSNATSTAQTLGGISSLLGATGRGGAALGNKSIVDATRKLGSVINNSGQILRQIDALATSKNINSTLGSYGSILSAAGRIAGTVSGNSKSTGLFNLPGGPLSVGSIVNKTLGSLGIPKNPVLGATITNAVTAAINNIAFPKAVAGSAGISSAISGLASVGTPSIGGLQNNAKGLVASAMSGLTPSQAGPLNAAMSAIGFGGAGAIKMPSIGINTNAVEEVNAQIGSLLADSRIPKPEFNESDESATAALESMLQQNDQIDSKFSEILELTLQEDQAKTAYYELENSLPPGSPEIVEARLQWILLSDEIQQKLDSIDSLTGDNFA